MNAYESLESLQIENESLRTDNQRLIQQNRNKDEYTNKLEEKILCLEKYINELEKENSSKNELFNKVIQTKAEFDKLKQTWSEKYTKLEENYLCLKKKTDDCSSQGINTHLQQQRKNNSKIDKCISNINNVSYLIYL